MGRRLGIEATQARSYKQIEGIAQDARRAMGFSQTEPLPGLRLFESLDRYSISTDGRVIPIAYEVSVLPYGVEAKAEYSKRRDEFVISLSQETYEDLEAARCRARFSLPHEVGHIVLHADQLVRFAQMPHEIPALYRGVAPNHPVYRDTEWQADTFAGAILMPAAGLMELAGPTGTPTINDIRNAYRVSGASAEIRLRIFRERRNELLN